MAHHQQKRCGTMVCRCEVGGIGWLTIEGPPRARPIQRGLRQDKEKENPQEDLTSIDNGRGKDKCMPSMLPQSWVAYKLLLFTIHLTSKFQLPQCLTSQFSVSSLPTSYNDSSPTNHVPNLLDGESNQFVSTDSEGYVETEVDWFDEPQLVETAKWHPFKMSEAITLEVCLCLMYLPSLHQLAVFSGHVGLIPSLLLGPP